jgi:hypothetical protein
MDSLYSGITLPHDRNFELEAYDVIFEQAGVPDDEVDSWGTMRKTFVVSESSSSADCSSIRSTSLMSHMRDDGSSLPTDRESELISVVSYLLPYDEDNDDSDNDPDDDDKLSRNNNASDELTNTDAVLYFISIREQAERVHNSYLHRQEQRLGNPFKNSSNHRRNFIRRDNRIAI